MHKEYSDNGNYTIKFGGILFDEDVLSKYNIKLKKGFNIISKERPFLGMNPEYSPSSLSFTSNYECGNLDLVI